MNRPNRIEPLPGQESVWDYPRPPRLEAFAGRVQIDFAQMRIVDAPNCFRVLETSHPPVYYIAPQYIAPGVLVPAQGTSMCEWKGRADYFDVVVNGQVAPRAAWGYTDPTDAFAPIAGFVAFYAGPMDRCTIAGETVTPQPGGFYGGWITKAIIGPFKGQPGSRGW